MIPKFFPHTDIGTYSVFFRLNTDTTDISVFENHTGYWKLVFSFYAGQVSDIPSFNSY